MHPLSLTPFRRLETSRPRQAPTCLLANEWDRIHVSGDGPSCLSQRTRGLSAPSCKHVIARSPSPGSMALCGGPVESQTNTLPTPLLQSRSVQEQPCRKKAQQQPFSAARLPRVSKEPTPLLTPFRNVRRRHTQHVDTPCQTDTRHQAPSTPSDRASTPHPPPPTSAQNTSSTCLHHR
uniref:Uncharacterized protein n=1 Tax=Toxoplasma gondii (strain ATCC 50861 / VEG) TaxID=432359 RepID=A0A0F7UTK3_TOXGV|nr:TPA: hypothetical protein BN1205_015000 [Toxoplasma gondii VEG]